MLKSFPYYLRGNVYAGIGEDAKALADWEKARSLDPTDTHARTALGEYYYEQGDFDRAIAYLDEAIEIVAMGDHNQAYSLSFRGLVYEKKGDSAKAIEDYKKALEYLESDARAIQGLKRLGVDLASLRCDWTVDRDIVRTCRGWDTSDRSAVDAIKLCKVALTEKCAPDHERSYLEFYLGEAYLEREQLDDALAAYNRAIDLNKKVGYFFRQRAKAYEALGNKEKAIADYKKILEVSPDTCCPKDDLQRLGGAVAQ